MARANSKNKKSPRENSNTGKGGRKNAASAGNKSAGPKTIAAKGNGAR